MIFNRKYLLFIGIFGGLAVALYSILARDTGLPPGAVARVNDSYITEAAYARALNAADTDKRNPLTGEDRRHILNRLIDEELLIQYGVRQGLVRSDSQVKATLVQSVLQAKTLQAEARDISDEEARGFFNANRALFSGTARSRVGLIRVPQSADRSLEQSETRASQAANALQSGESFAAVQAQYHEGGVLNLPDTPLPYGKLVDYLGPTLAGRAMALAPGEATDPLLIGQAWQVLYLHERSAAPEVDFETARELVLAEMRRRAAEDILRKSLEDMYGSEEIVIAEDLW